MFCHSIARRQARAALAAPEQTPRARAQAQVQQPRQQPRAGVHQQQLGQRRTGTEQQHGTECGAHAGMQTEPRHRYGTLALATS
jgi:hypothetical protein